MRTPKLKRVGLAFFSIFFLIAESNSADDSKMVEADVDDFKCLTEMTAAGAFFVDNVLGDLAATLAVANSDEGGQYPAGSLVSLVPSEVMVKHKEGWNPETNDWEFIELTVSDAGSVVKSRGTTEIINQFGGNCFDCHKLAEPKWDSICGTGHGCAPLPITREIIAGIQQADPRCAKKD